MADNILKQSIERQKIDRERTLRVVKYIDCPFILSNTPVELVEGYIVTDRITCELFASFVFKNISIKPVKKLKIRLDCYKNQNIPYLHIDYVYSQDELTFGMISKNGVDMKYKEANKRTYIETNETFGSCVFIPLPESYFTKLEVILSEVEYLDNTTQVLNLVVAGNSNRYSELDNITKSVYSRVNIYSSAESKYPTVVVPQFGESGWLCCCGNKNPVASEECHKCGREREWQRNTITKEALQKKKEELIADPREVIFHDKSKFKQNKMLDNEADVQKKIEQYEKAIENLAREEKIRARRKRMLIPKIIGAALILFGIVFALRVVRVWMLYKYPDKYSSETSETNGDAANINIMEQLF